MQRDDESGRDEAVHRLFDALIVLGRALKARGSAYADPVLSRADVQALGIIATHGPCRAGHLAEHLCVDRSVISRQLAALADHGLVERAADPEDGRAELVSLTDDGRQRLVAARDALCAELSQRLEPWDGTGIDRVATTVTELAARLHHPAPPMKDHHA